MGQDKTLVEAIRRDIAKTGYPTEVLTASLLDRLGWKTLLGPSYQDEKEGVSREFDIRAYRQYVTTPEASGFTLGVYLMLECKKSDKPWVFFTTQAQAERDNQSAPGRLLQSPHSRKDPIFWSDTVSKMPVIRDDDWQTFHHYITHHSWAHNYYEPFKNMERSDRSVQIHTAVRSVVNATRFYLDNFPNSDRWIPIFYPVIVFDGELFEAVVRSKDEVDILPTEHVVLKHHFIPSPTGLSDRGFKGKTVLVDVISAGYVPDFSTLIDRESYTLFQLLRVAAQEGRFPVPR